MRTLKVIVLVLVCFALLAVVLYWVPPVHQRLSWRVDFALAYLRGVVDPVEPLPTPLPEPHVLVADQPTGTPTAMITETQYPTATQGATVTQGATATPVPTATLLPASVALDSPGWEKQDINNCGPAALAMYLRYYGWDGDQSDIAQLLKPKRQDRNVNVEELVYYVRTQAGWLNAEYRVGGDIDLLKEFLAAGIPLMIEESFYFEAPYWPNDDLWAAHYNLITGYDDASQTFIGQDSYHGPDQLIPYETLDAYWQPFNRVYILLYLPQQEHTVKDILGDDWDVDINRQYALDVAKAETNNDSQNAFAWFNLGTNLAYFEAYSEAADAYDVARTLGLPQRMLRYQFGPFMAYFHSARMEDLMTLAEYALQRTPNAEEALLWRGWGHYRLGDTALAMHDFRQALQENPYYQDAQYALSYIDQNR
ncbi:MAG: C39 family peptidase [Chloroflexota bacterium]|nr:C39 family peptidase [Chloroflexota bacterium]